MPQRSAPCRHGVPARHLLKAGLGACLALAAAACSAAGASGVSTSGAAALASTGLAAPTPGAAQTKTITFTTNGKPVVVATDPKAPETVASMTQLAQAGYFDGSPCHRLVTAGIYVLQCGDPTGTGRGGPGYTVPDENLPTPVLDDYPAGTVAMANAGPGTTGSHFFIVYHDTTLPPSYTIWGTVSKGLDQVLTIAAKGVQGGHGRPADGAGQHRAGHGHRLSRSIGVTGCRPTPGPRRGGGRLTDDAEGDHPGQQGTRERRALQRTSGT